MPEWRGDGKELFYIAYDLTLMAVDIKLNPAVEIGTPHPLFQTNLTGIVDGRTHYAVRPDGQRFLISSPAKSDSAGVIKIVMNWPELLKKGR